MILKFVCNYILLLTNSICFYKFLHIYQLKDYNNSRYLKFFIKKSSFFIIFALILFIFQYFFNNLIFIFVSNIIFYILNLFYLKYLISSKKTPLKFTNKLKRIYIISILILFTLSFYHLSFMLIIFISPLLPILSNTINLYDKFKNIHFIHLAQKKLKNHQTKIIAITGSNGKTSVKNILHKMLETEHKTQSTPASFNTPLGIAKFINYELKFDTEFLILEYGARRKNDIEKLCKIFGADYGIITTISPQHIETFKTKENIFFAKKRLADFLQNRMCVFNTDNLYVNRMFEEKVGEKLSVSIFSSQTVFASNIKISNNKMCFNLNINGKSHFIETSLLGRHNILNICLCATLANYLNIKTKNIIETIRNLQPVPHRLELIKTNINILDDTYNCSLTSATEALWVLKNMPNKKMIATPGIVECGKEKYNINFKLGEMMRFCDYCIIIGNENKQTILEGIQNKTFSNTQHTPKTYCVKNLEEAKQYFSLLNNNDTLLLLNDLPDDYI